jgi:hypothetical protein
MEVVAVARRVSVSERRVIKLDLIKASMAAKKRKEDLAMLLVDTSDMEDDVRAWCADERARIMAERRAPTAPQHSSTTPPATSTPPSSFFPLATENLPATEVSPEEVPSRLEDHRSRPLIFGVVNIGRCALFVLVR